MTNPGLNTAHVAGDTGHIADHNAIATFIDGADGTYAAKVHGHVSADVTGLDASLAAKLVAANNLSDVTNTTLARTNIGAGIGMSLVALKTANYAANANEFVPIDTTSGTITVTLPTAPAANTVVGVRLAIQGSSNPVNITCGGSDKVDSAAGSATTTLTLLTQGKILQYLSGIWYIIDSSIALSTLTPAAIGAATGADISTAVANLQAKTVTVVFEVAGNYPARPSNYDMVIWKGPDAPAIGGTGALADVDEWHQTP